MVAIKKLASIFNPILHAFLTIDLRIKIIGPAVGSVLIIGIVVTWHSYSLMSRHLNEELAFQSSGIARELAGQAATPLLMGNIFALHQVMNTTLQTNSTVRYIFIMDARGAVLTHTFGIGFPEGLTEANNLTADNRQQIKIINTDEGSVFDTAAPVLNGKAGIVRVGLSDREKKSTLGITAREQLLVTALVAFLGLVVAFMLGSFISSQVKALAQAARAVARGDLGHQVRVWSKDDIGHLTQAFNAMSTSLVSMKHNLEQREAVRRKLLAKVIAAQEEERRRVARELHDDLGQSLSSLGYGLQTASLALETAPLKVKPLLHGLQEENQRIQKEVRATISALRPSALDDLGLIPALRSLTESRLSSQDIKVEFAMEGEELRLSPEVETAIYRIVQEAINNIVRHAKARSVRIQARFNSDKLAMNISDDGCGFDSSSWEFRADGRGFGILGMYERAELMEGKLEVVSRPGKGCRINLYIPNIPNHRV